MICANFGYIFPAVLDKKSKMYKSNRHTPDFRRAKDDQNSSLELPAHVNKKKLEKMQCP
jgi:hypothetical protein